MESKPCRRRRQATSLACLEQAGNHICETDTESSALFSASLPRLPLTHSCKAHAVEMDEQVDIVGETRMT